LLFQANQPIRSNFILIHLAVAAKSAGELNNFFEFFSPEFLDKSLLVVACFAFDLRLAHTGRAPHQSGCPLNRCKLHFWAKKTVFGRE
jgi:hypothetical protein